MKRSALFYFLLLFSLPASAQKQTFDLTSYVEPQDWNKEVTDQFVSYTFVSDKTKNWCKIVIYKSTETRGGVEKDFESGWNELIVKQYEVKDTPQLYTPPAYEGWDVRAGAGTFIFNNATSMAMLITMSGYGKATSIVALTNSQDYISTIDSFLSSVDINKPGESDIGIVGTWQKKSGAHVSYGDPVSYGTSGYSKDQYSFNKNGTYEFASKTFSAANEKIIVVKEKGTYEIKENVLVVTPKTSVIEAWSKKGGTDKYGKLLSSKKRPLEKTSYHFTRHYFSGIDEWNLVLQTGKPTGRDGNFSSNNTFANAYYYSPIGPTNPPIDLPAPSK